MQKRTISWKLMAGASCALIVSVWSMWGSVWAGSHAADSHNQDTHQDATVSRAPQVREAANVVGLVVQGGVTRGQTLRFHFFLPAECALNPGPPQLRLTVFDTQGGVLASTMLVVSGPNQNGPVRFAQFDLNADQIPQEKFDQTGRVQFTGVLGALISTNPGPPQIPGPHVLGVLTGEVFDNLNGKTIAHIQSATLLECDARRR